MLIPLKDLICELEEDKRLEALLSSFSCVQDFDIENFLHCRALEFERLSKSRTYLVFDEHELATRDVDSLTIYGYISLALKVLTVAEKTSNRKRKELDGFNAKIKGKPISDFLCYLIGQLARNSDVSSDCLSGKRLIEFARDVISASVEAVGGRYVMIECRDAGGLVHFYQENGFSEISRLTDGEQPMVQMISKIC